LPTPSPGIQAILYLAIGCRFYREGCAAQANQRITEQRNLRSLNSIQTIIRLHEGKTIADVHRWRKDDGKGSVPFDAMGGVLDSHDLKRVLWLRKNFTAGRYVLHCEMPLVTNAEPTNQEITHADLGMVREIEITE
jgi:hypothetical protein